MLRCRQQELGLPTRAKNHFYAFRQSLEAATFSCHNYTRKAALAVCSVTSDDRATRDDNANRHVSVVKRKGLMIQRKTLEC